MIGQAFRNFFNFAAKDYQPATEADFASCAPKSQRTKRGRGANGHAGVFARALMRGGKLSQSEYCTLLHERMATIPMHRSRA